MITLEQYKEQINNRLKVAQEFIDQAISPENVDLIVDNVTARCKELSHLYAKHSSR